MRRSARKLKRIWLGGRSPSGRFGRYVAHGPAWVTAHSMLRLKKHPSQETFACPFTRAFDIRTAIKALLDSIRQAELRKSQQFRDICISLQLAGILYGPNGFARIFRGFRR
jgi:hypothetical protein